MQKITKNIDIKIGDFLEINNQEFLVVGSFNNPEKLGTEDFITYVLNKPLENNIKNVTKGYLVGSSHVFLKTRNPFLQVLYAKDI